MSGFVYNSCSKNGISLHQKPVKFESGVDVNLEKAFELYKRGDVLFIDVRSGYSFKRGHIKNAVNLPAKSTNKKIEQILSGVSKDQLIVTYCSGST